MRTTLNKIATGLLLGFLAIAPLQAQNNTPVEANTNHASGYSEEFQGNRLELEKEMQKDKLETEKAIADSTNSSHRMMVHDLAWNSWVIFVIAVFFFGYLKDKRRHETIRLMVEKGTPLTPELLAGLRKNRGRLTIRTTYDPYGYLCWGVTLVAVGIALQFVATKAAWIVLAVGIANLILWVIDKLHSNDSQPK